MAPSATTAESSTSNTRATPANAAALRRDRRRRRSEIEQNSRLRQKRNFNYLVENIIDRSLAELAASRFGPRELDSLVRQLKRCVHMFRLHAEDLAKNGRNTEITAPEDHLVQRKNEMSLIAREILVHDHATQVLPRVTHSRCYTFLRAVFDSCTSDGRKKFRWDASEEFEGLDVPLLRVWLDVITTHYLTCFMRTAPAYATYMARLQAVAPSSSSPTSTPVPPSRALPPSAASPASPQRRLAAATQPPPPPSTPSTPSQPSPRHHHHAHQPHHEDDDDAVRHLQSHSDSAAFAHEGGGHHTSPAISFCPPMIPARNNSSGSQQPPPPTSTSTHHQHALQQQAPLPPPYYLPPRPFGGAWADGSGQPAAMHHMIEFPAMGANGGGPQGGGGGAPRTLAEVMALLRQPEARSIMPIEDMHMLATWLYGSPAAAAAATAAAANVHATRIRDILN